MGAPRRGDRSSRRTESEDEYNARVGVCDVINSGSPRAVAGVAAWLGSIRLGAAGPGRFSRCRNSRLSFPLFSFPRWW